MSDPTPETLAEHAVNGELKDSAASVLLDREDFCFQLLGVDTADRAVYYAADDGTLARYHVTEDGMEQDRDASRHIGQSLDSAPERVDPFATAFTYLTTQGEDWDWIHPRFRWIVSELDAMDGDH